MTVKRGLQPLTVWDTAFLQPHLMLKQSVKLKPARTNPARMTPKTT